MDSSPWSKTNCEGEIWVGECRWSHSNDDNIINIYNKIVAYARQRIKWKTLVISFTRLIANSSKTELKRLNQAWKRFLQVLEWATKPTNESLETVKLGGWSMYTSYNSPCKKTFLMFNWWKGQWWMAAMARKRQTKVILATRKKVSP